MDMNIATDTSSVLKSDEHLVQSFAASNALKQKGGVTVITEADDGYVKDCK